MGKKPNKEVDKKNIKNSNSTANKDIANNNLESKANIEENENDKIKRILGFNDFSTTKNKSHTHSDLSGAFNGAKLKSRFRQYVNRRCGFNKPLGKDK